MRLLALFLHLVLLSPVCAALPPALQTALKNFRGDPPPGWSYTQTTAGQGKSTVERCDAAKPEFDRWSLVQVDGRAPTPDELARYAENRSRRSRTGTAPRISEQLDLTSCETLSDAPDRARYRFRLRPGESSDKTAPALRATLSLHKPTQTVESIELSNVAEFAPTLGVKISELKTTMTYSLPDADRPALPQKVETRTRGRAFFFKTLDADMRVTFSDYAPARKR